MNNKEMTHIGTLGTLPRCGDKKEVFLRETKLFFVSEDGVKYRKRNGFPTDNSMYRLDVNSVERV